MTVLGNVCLYHCCVILRRSYTLPISSTWGVERPERSSPTCSVLTSNGHHCWTLKASSQSSFPCPKRFPSQIRTVPICFHHLSVTDMHRLSLSLVRPSQTSLVAHSIHSLFLKMTYSLLSPATPKIFSSFQWGEDTLNVRVRLVDLSKLN